VKTGWQTRPLGELCELRNGSTPSTSNSAYWAGGEIPWFTINDLRDQGRSIRSTTKTITQTALKETSVKLLPAGSVLLCCTASVGEFAIARIPLTTNQQFVGLVVRDRTRLSPEFLFHFASTLKDQLLGLSGKTTIDFVPISRLRDVAVPLPPLTDQQRIVGILDEAFAAIATARANTEQNVRNVRELFERHLRASFTQACEGRKATTLGDLIEIQGGFAFRSTEYAEAGYFVMRIGNVQDGQITLSSPKYVQLANGGLDRFILNEGDILVSLTGNIGRVGIIQKEHLPAVLNQRVARITVSNPGCDRDFVFRFLSSSAFREALSEAGHGAAQQNVSAKEIETVQIYLPSIERQRKAVEAFDRFDAETERLASIYDRKLAALDALKQSLLHQAFTGAL
jgi:type I restriction enzyme S subunit